jgi:pimeloyl-ACP methyl ester carboxylesterase
MNGKDFERQYSHVPVEQTERLQQFRATHSYTNLRIGSRSWPYIACGRGQKTLLFLAGGFLRADMWFYAIGELEQTFSILAPDSYLLHHLSFKEAVEAIPRLLEHAGVDRATAIGLSAGGGLAQMLVNGCPERVEHLVLSHTSLLESNPQDLRRIQRIRRLVRFLPLFLIKRILLKRTSGKLPASSRWLRFHEAYFQETNQSMERAMFQRFLEDGLEARQGYTFQPDRLDEWSGQVLILNSQDDQVTMPGIKKLQARFPQARVHLFAEGGHHTFLLFPEMYTAALKDFLHQAI